MSTELHKPKIVLVGGGGHCKVVISVLKKLEAYEIVGISDLLESMGTSLLDIEIKFTDQNLKELFNSGIQYALVTLGSIGVSEKRKELYCMLKDIGFVIPSIVSNEAIVDESVLIDEGSVVMPGAIINACTEIGKNCIINTGAIIEHDCHIGDHVHIAPGVTLSGSVKIGNYSHIGTGSSVIQNIYIGEKVMVGAGSVVVKNVSDDKKVFGVPAKERLTV
ncbi:MAG TPA: acetyltransferase [Caldisericia bacterium]|nr:acetyltransferase [Caldisericia bacterium]